jgi:hypothetical protein
MKARAVNWRDMLERLFWTSVTAVLGNVTGAALFEIAVWKAAALTGVMALISGVLVIARYRLSVLPTPGSAIREQTAETLLTSRLSSTLSDST